MSINIGHKESPAAVLSAVTAEMAKPRVVESAKGAKTRKEHAARKEETPVPFGRGAGIAHTRRSLKLDH